MKIKSKAELALEKALEARGLKPKLGEKLKRKKVKK